MSLFKCSVIEQILKNDDIFFSKTFFKNVLSVDAINCVKH